MTERREPDSVKIARIEEAVTGIREDVADIKATLKTYDRRTTYLEDVRVRGLEEREIRRKAIEEERARAGDAARAAAERAAAHVSAEHKLRISRRDLWATAILIAAATIIAALLGHPLI